MKTKEKMLEETRNSYIQTLRAFVNKLRTPEKLTTEEIHLIRIGMENCIKNIER